MGTSISKDGEVNKGIEEESTGFHVIEIHAPTVGVGITMIIMASLFACAAYACYRKIRQRTERRMQRQRRNENLLYGNLQEIPMTPIGHYQQSAQIPAIGYPADRENGRQYEQNRFQDITEDNCRLAGKPSTSRV